MATKASGYMMIASDKTSWSLLPPNLDYTQSKRNLSTDTASLFNGKKKKSETKGKTKNHLF